jgi:hypothetical protein
MTRGDTKRHGPRVIEVRFRKVGEITVSLHANRKVISFGRKRKRALADTLTHTTASRARVDAEGGTRIHGHQGRARPCPRQLYSHDMRARTIAQVVAAAVGRASNVGTPVGPAHH